mmetsp:Transcript_20005/g.37170  ORF Transcript_20005/g.37170 Transcript_20005/m.37170 type:complete len:239 (-) Transcript_20005:1639-2355(-)
MNSNRPWVRKAKFKAIKASLWSLLPDTLTETLPATQYLPQLRIPPDVVLEVWRQSRFANCSNGILVGFCDGPCHVNLEEVLWKSSKAKPKGDCGVAIRAQEQPTHEELDNMLNRIICKLNNGLGTGRESTRVIGPIDLFKICLIFEASESSLKLDCNLIYPDYSFTIAPASPIKIVSVELSRELVKCTSETFRSGYLTMDSSKRLLPLEPKDPNVLNYPIVGVWVAGLHSLAAVGRTI